MPTYSFDDLIYSIKDRRIITFDNVMALRRSFFMDGQVSEAEAEALFLINHIYTEADPAWYDFFVEALTEYCVHQAEPSGYISPENANWLIAQCQHDGKIETATELELLISVLEVAQLAPIVLVQFTLEQVKHAVLQGQGPLRMGAFPEQGVIHAEEIQLLRRILYAFAGDGNIAITRAEADILFDINDAVQEKQTHAEWTDLFVKAIANHILAGVGYQAPSRKEALQRAEWLERKGNVNTFLAQMAAGGFKAICSAYRMKSPEDESLERLAKVQRSVALGEEVAAFDSEWLVKRMTAKPALDENGQALLNFLKNEAVQLGPVVRTHVLR